LVKLGSLDPRTGFLLQLEVLSDGGAVNTAKLAQFFSTVRDKQLWQKNPDKYQEISADQGDKYQGHYSLLNPVGAGNTRQLPLASGMLSLWLADRQDPVRWDLRNRPWTMGEIIADEQSQSVSLLWTLLSGDQPVVRLTKTYRLVKGDYTVYVSLKLENLTDEPLKISLEQAGPAGVPREDPARDSRQLAYGRFVPSDQAVRVSRIGFDKADPSQPGGTAIGSSANTEPVIWTGLINKFFGSMLYITPHQADAMDATPYRATYTGRGVVESPTSRIFVPMILLSDINLAPRDTSRPIDLEVFTGPKKREMFVDPQAAYYRPIYTRLHYIGTIDLGRCFMAPVWLTLGMMWLLGMFSKLALGNYGVAIILLVFLVRLVLHPLTKKSQVSMMNMQKLAPQIQKLREKYANDKDALNRETMQVYKKQGATPLLGCLPMLLQMPIWVALFTALSVSIELRHSAFLPVWITDLSSPDRLFEWSARYTLPLIGHCFNLLPILLTVAMFFQSKVNPQMTGAAATSPDQQKQQQMMRYMMPLMMLFFFYNSPSGLTLYIMASTFAGVAEQIVIRRHIEAHQAVEAARQTTVKIPGKGFRDSRGKKPKGPFWVKRG